MSSVPTPSSASEPAQRLSTVTPTPTFRDPAGSLHIEDEFAVRAIHPAARDQVMEFVTSQFCSRLQERGDMVAITLRTTPNGLSLLHPRIPVPTYPWEWTPTQWLAAADLTLNLCEEALAEGWVLKDATPLNILFVGPRPVLVDVLSFDPWDGSSLWLAYAQYIRTFVLPLLMNRLLGWPLTLALFKRDGFESTELYDALSWRQRLGRAAFWTITLPTWSERRNPDAPVRKPKPPKDPDLALHILRGSLKSLRKLTRRAMPKRARSSWSQYKSTRSHYTTTQSAQKTEWVRNIFEDLKPARVLDIGANTGEFSALAAEKGARVVAIERDGPAADRLFRMSRRKRLAIQTIHGDLARPTPAVGWENRESTTLIHRLEGQSDLVLMLAVIHHLLLMEQIPLPAIIELCHRLTFRYLIVEWVPVEDPMFQSLMRGRDELYASLAEADLLAACKDRFHVLRRHSLENGRVLFLFVKD
jgi:SAM-dependent methyltransferase